MARKALSLSRPTLNDVAALAGVGKSTVSRVLNDGPSVRPIVREKVRKAIETLGYTVNLQARNLAGGVGQQVIIFHCSDFDDVPNSFYHSAIELGALRASAARGFQVTSRVVPRAPTLYRSMIVDLVKAGRCDQIVFTPPLSDDGDLLHQLKSLKCPVVCISAGPAAQEIAASIGIDDEQAGYDIANHLVELGHERFGFIKGPQDHRSAERRYSGFLRALSDAGLPPRSDHVERGDFSTRSGLELAQKILTRPDRPTALLCANDDMAAGALLSAHKAGLSIPDDVSITGFDNSAISEIVWPPLTTIHHPIRQLGADAIGLLAQQRNGTLSAGGSYRLLGHHLVVRESCGKPVRDP